MLDLIDQLRRCRESGLYYASLIGVLTLPDICGALGSENGYATGEKYARWFDENVAPRYNGFLDGEACYYFRCSLLHQGSTLNSRGRYSRILFVEPATPGLVMHNNVLNDALNLDANIFCEDMCDGAESWWRNSATNGTVVRNFERFVRRHPNGLPPYIVGVPVIS